METQVRGVFLTSGNPEATAEFYMRAALLPLEAVGEQGEYTYWRLDRDGMQLAIHDAEAFAAYAHPPDSESNLTHLYFKIADHKAFLAHLDRLGVSPLAVDDVVITVVDPDGRKVMFGTA
jgi:catechol 2,3-dioxygenase-like lactoylglutathione lyase family enzyme